MNLKAFLATGAAVLASAFAFTGAASASDAALNWGSIDAVVADDGRSVTLTHNHSAGDRWQLVGPAPYAYKVYSGKNPVTVACPGDAADLNVQRADDMHWIKVFNTKAPGGWKQLAELDFYLNCDPAPVTPDPEPTPDPTPVTPGTPMVPNGNPTPTATPEPSYGIKIGKVGPRSSRSGTFQRYRLVAINTGDVDQKIFLRDEIPLGAYPVTTGLLPNGLVIGKNGIVRYKTTLKPGQRIIKQFYVKFHRPSGPRCTYVNNMFSVLGPNIGRNNTGFVQTRVCGPATPIKVPVTG